jgi:2-keto-4-pentenoate hydratase
VAVSTPFTPVQVQAQMFVNKFSTVNPYPGWISTPLAAVIRLPTDFVSSGGMLPAGAISTPASISHPVTLDAGDLMEIRIFSTSSFGSADLTFTVGVTLTYADLI